MDVRLKVFARLFECMPSIKNLHIIIVLYENLKVNEILFSVSGVTKVPFMSIIFVKNHGIFLYFI